MKALTISQPYASLIASGEKWVENRTWSTPYRGLLAIHAGKGQQYMKHRDMDDAKLPYGAIVAVARLVGCERKSTIDFLASTQGVGGEKRNDLGNRNYREVSCHRHAEGPFCWILANVTKLPEPIKCSGAQGLWIPNPDVQETLKQIVEHEQHFDPTNFCPGYPNL